MTESALRILKELVGVWFSCLTQTRDAPADRRVERRVAPQRRRRDPRTDPAAPRPARPRSAIGQDAARIARRPP